MFKLDTFLQILPKIASHPLAILAYITIYSMLIGDQRWDVADDFAKALVNRGITYATLGQPKDALSDFNHSMELWDGFIERGHPDATNELPTLLINRASTYFKINQSANAMRDIARAISVLEPQVKSKPNLSELRDELEKCLVIFGMQLIIDNKIEQAKPYLEDVIKLDANQKLTKCANLLLEAQTSADAFQAQKKILEIYQNN